MVKNSKDKSKSMVNEVCKDCWRWEEFGIDCHYFWENKSECSQFMQSEDSEPIYVKEEELK